MFYPIGFITFLITNHLPKWKFLLFFIDFEKGYHKIHKFCLEWLRISSEGGGGGGRRKEEEKEERAGKRMASLQVRLRLLQIIPLLFDSVSPGKLPLSDKLKVVFDDGLDRY